MGEGIFPHPIFTGGIHMDLIVSMMISLVCIVAIIEFMDDLKDKLNKYDEEKEDK